MSLVITTYVPEGIVMASDSRQSITIGGKTPDGKELPKVDTVNSDNVYKTYLLSRKDKNDKPIFEVGSGKFYLVNIFTGRNSDKFIKSIKTKL